MDLESRSVLALLLPVPTASPAVSPSPSAGPGVSVTPDASASPRTPLKTIVTVKSSPYCSALEDHFNSALVPMIANDRVFTTVDGQFDDMNNMFKYPNYIDRFVVLRTKLLKETGVLENSLKPIQQQIDALRNSATLSTDPVEQKQMRDAASQLQDAYKHQFQLSTDLTGLAQSMMQYNIFAGARRSAGGRRMTIRCLRMRRTSRAISSTASSSKASTTPKTAPSISPTRLRPTTAGSSSRIRATYRLFRRWR